MSIKIDLQFQPVSTVAKLELAAGDTCIAEAGSLVAMKGNISLTTTTHRKGSSSVFGAAKRLFLSGESFFLNEYQAHSDGVLWLTSSLPGDMLLRSLSGESIVVQGGSFMACESSVELTTEWQGFKSMFSGENLFWLKLSGKGQCILHSFGAIHEVDVDGSYIVDTGHIVAFEETLDFSISKAGSSWIHSFLGGEGFVCNFKGRGKIWIQSHHDKKFGGQLTPHLLARK